MLGFDLSDIAGLIGILAIVAGLRLLWQSRHEIRLWLEAFVGVLRGQLAGSGTPERPLRPAVARQRHTLRIAIAMFLILFVGPVLIALGIIF